MKLLIIGSNGRLGKALLRHYAERYKVMGLQRSDIDLRHLGAIKEILKEQEFDVVINTAALTNVDYCEDHSEEAFAVNAEAVGILAQVALEKKARLFHISTDYVFDGQDPALKKETDPAHPLSVYGRSKLAGEEKVLAVSPDFSVIRVSWVFGPDRPSFIDSFLHNAQNHEEVAAIGDKYSCPTYTEDFANWLHPLLENPHPGGILHLCNGGSCSWKEYGQYALEVAKKNDIPIKASTVHSLQLEEMESFKAQRPIHTAMSTERYTEITGITPRPWQEAVEAYVLEHYLREKTRG